MTGTRVSTAAGGQALELSWVQPFGMVGLSIANFIRRVLTLGIYDFWGRTEVRRRIWSGVRLDGEPLVYHGTGRELFVGFLIVFLLVLLPIMLSGLVVVAVFGASPGVTGLFQTVIFAVASLLFGVGSYRAQRYRLSRTTWRGIRGSVAGNSWAYGWTYFWTLLLIPLTLGWIIPWRATALQRRLTANMSFGDKPFVFQGHSLSLYGPFSVMWLGIPTILVLASVVIGASGLLPGPQALEALGDGRDLAPDIRARAALLPFILLVVGYVSYVLIGAWYQARVFNHFARSTLFGAAHFEGRATGLGLAFIGVTNMLILALGAVVATSLLSAILVGVVYLLGPDQAQYARTLTAMAPVFVIIAILSFGLLLPVTQARYSRYLVEHLRLVGPVDVDAIAQGAKQEINRGEGLAQAFDVDAF
ncbi:MAG: DUF898 family protein [Hyphomicrobiaceae bacterium]|nr:DUF898 family protein [Hyphomicrobiaceae bacterium]